MRIARAVLLVLASAASAHPSASTGFIPCDSIGAIGAAVDSPQEQAAAPAPPAADATRPPAWAIGSYQAYDPDSGDIDTGRHFHFRRHA